MRSPVRSLPEMKPANEEKNTEEELHFCTLAEAAEKFARSVAGKPLFVSDFSSFTRLAFAASKPRAISVVLENDALPLFSMPDGVGGVFAAGTGETLVAARFFAALRRIPCVTAPSDGALDGLFCSAGRVMLDGSELEVPLAAADIVCDAGFMAPSLGGARARIALSRLACFEAHALAIFCGEEKLPQSCPPVDGSPHSVIRANAMLRRGEAAGAWAGEGAVLARLYPEPDARRALAELSALYGAFFHSGRPRRYAVPDYAARAARAGVPFAAVRIPTVECYARRALMLERRRADLVRELELVLRQNASENGSVFAFSRTGSENEGLEYLMRLPEKCPDGLCAVVRDFGLLERT